METPTLKRIRLCHGCSPLLCYHMSDGEVQTVATHHLLELVASLPLANHHIQGQIGLTVPYVIFALSFASCRRYQTQYQLPGLTS